MPQQLRFVARWSLSSHCAPNAHSCNDHRHGRYLRRCGLGDDGAKTIAEALAGNCTVQQIRLSENDIGDEGARALAETLTNVRPCYLIVSQLASVCVSNA